MSFSFLFGRIAKGDSLARALMNERLRRSTMRGRVLDLGGGRRSDYHGLIKREAGAEIVVLDAHFGEKRLDFETDPLPFGDSSIDTVLMMNLLEHLYDYQFVVSEVCRVLRPGGKVLGFVPFLVNYHPDPHDYFRYTKEALSRMFSGLFKKIAVEEVGIGPFSVHLNDIMLYVPKWARLALFTLLYALDRLAVALRPAMRERFPLGYFFELKK